MKKNCWEIMRCGREPMGENVEKHGICPAATFDLLNGVHGGKNAGRVCWIIAGTMCGGEIEGSFAKKYKDCRECSFYQQVKKEEGSEFLLTIDLLRWFAEKSKKVR
jgi:hypothetical protein